MRAEPRKQHPVRAGVVMATQCRPWGLDGWKASEFWNIKNCEHKSMPFTSARCLCVWARGRGRFSPDAF